MSHSSDLELAVECKNSEDGWYPLGSAITPDNGSQLALILPERFGAGLSDDK